MFCLMRRLRGDAVVKFSHGALQGTFRSTEQGEMVEAKFGLPQIAVRQLEIYTTAVLLATLRPPLPPSCGWIHRI